ncbi:MAG TPA: hypothetical protein GXZ89_01670 [Fastidiosipila sp.]|nr:hypothetical protein [Fastidiosipila sp.]
MIRKIVVIIALLAFIFTATAFASSFYPNHYEVGWYGAGYNGYVQIKPSHIVQDSFGTYRVAKGTVNFYGGQPNQPQYVTTPWGDGPHDSRILNNTIYYKALSWQNVRWVPSFVRVPLSNEWPVNMPPSINDAH